VIRIIPPDHFARTFHKVVESRAKDIRRLWDNWDARSYTRYFVNREDGVLAEVCERLDLKYATPWWTIDAIYYESADVENFPVAWRMAKHICVAIEHENSVGRSHYEVNKLSLFNSPLKVLIAYPGRDSGPNAEALVLERYARILQDADVFRNFSESLLQLAVFGSRDENHDPIWRYHLYTGSGFRELHV
jgi:hypothetical protein